MTTEITPVKVQAVAQILSAGWISHDLMWDILLPGHKGIAPHLTPFEYGCALHRTLLRLRDRGPLSEEERPMMEWISAVRDSLRERGVCFFEPEKYFAASRNFPGGSIDLVLTGGLSRRGVAELKVTGALPLGPAPAHLLQLAGYEELLARETGEWRLWGCLAYVVPPAGRIRVFAYRHVGELRKLARQILAS